MMLARSLGNSRGVTPPPICVQWVPQERRREWRQDGCGETKSDSRCWAGRTRWVMRCMVAQNALLFNCPVAPGSVSSLWQQGQNCARGAVVSINRLRHEGGTAAQNIACTHKIALRSASGRPDCCSTSCSCWPVSRQRKGRGGGECQSKHKVWVDQKAQTRQRARRRRGRITLQHVAACAPKKISEGGIIACAFLGREQRRHGGSQSVAVPAGFRVE